MTARRRWAATLLDCLLVLILSWLLIRPLFKARYLDRFESIESTFIADGRFLLAHGPHPRWQPLWYCGTRFDYIYPPALRYGTALLSRIWIPAKAYHVYTAFFYCVGILGVYLLVRLAGRSRAGAWLAAAATATLSPSFLFLTYIRNDAPFLTPQRLGVLVRYGEGPHMTALALLPFALACAFFGLQRRRPAALAGAAIFSALAVSNNFYGATALAIFFPILVWSMWVTHGDRVVWLRAAAIAALSWGLTAFWLVPSYLRITWFNMRYVSEPGHAWSAVLGVAVAAGFGWVTWKLARGRAERAWLVFVCGSVLFFSLVVLGGYFFDFRVIGLHHRLVPELDLALTLAAVEGLRRLWRCSPARARLVPRICAVALVLAAAWTARTYVRHAHELFPLHADYRQRIEYRIDEWMARNLPGVRALAAGSVRFWYDAWFDLAQLGGGSQQGLLNPNVAMAEWQIIQNDDPAVGVRWMQAMGVDAIIVHDKNSQEHYHDYSQPRKFAGLLPVLWDSGAGDTIYRVPRRFPGLARVVNRRALEAARPVSEKDDGAVVGYTAAVEGGARAPATLDWPATDEMRIRARVNAGESVLVQVTYDPAWRATSNGAALPVRKDAMGFMVVNPPAGEHDLRLVFTLPLENLLGRIATFLSLGIVAALLWAPRSRGEGLN